MRKASASTATLSLSPSTNTVVACMNQYGERQPGRHVLDCTSLNQAFQWR